jgi:hypothetical protein
MQTLLTRPRPPRPRPGPRLFAFSPTLHAQPGGRARFVVRVSNGDTRELAVHFGLAGLGDAWKATLSQSDLLVPARGHALVALRLDVPEEAMLGERHTLRLAAEMGGHRAFLDLEAVVDNRL